MDLKELLGDAYKEGMTFDEINTALSNKKIADLSTGKYVNKEMAEAEKTRLENEKKDLETQLNAKLTDDEKANKIAKEKDKQIQKLMEQLKANTLNANKNKIFSSTNEIRTKIDISDADEEFNKFAGMITLEDNDNSTFVSNYLAKIVKVAYDKGVSDTKKEQIADNKPSNFKQGGDNSGKNKDENLDYGARLARKNKTNKKQTYNYFE